MTYRIDVISLDPKIFLGLFDHGVIGKAFSNKIADLNLHNPREFALDRYRKVDDLPYGGGSGMVLKPEPYFAALESIPRKSKSCVLMMTPQGKVLHQSDLHRWAGQYEQLIFICGQYEGFDERIRTLADEEISVGDFVLTGGEIPAMAIINGVIRLLPGTVGDAESVLFDSHTDLLLEHPHYTRPSEFRGMNVPDIVKCGDHAAVNKWREKQRQLRTKVRRPDLYKKWLKKNIFSNSINAISSNNSDEDN